jgi:hypothetical protein
VPAGKASIERRIWVSKRHRMLVCAVQRRLENGVARPGGQDVEWQGIAFSPRGGRLKFQQRRMLLFLTLRLTSFPSC